MSLNGFMWVKPSIVGNAKSWEEIYTVSECFPSIIDAYNAGIDDLGHDDFIVAEWQKSKVIAIYGGPKKSDIREELLPDYRRGLKNHFGLDRI